MSYICKECGHIFDEGEQKVWYESHGLDEPPYERWCACPVCNGDYEEAVECEICGSLHREDDLNGGVCNDCINDYRHAPETCKSISTSTGQIETIEIDSFLASVFEPADIEQILMDFIRERNPEIDCSAFVDEDKYWFGEQLAKEVKKKNENKKG